MAKWGNCDFEQLKKLQSKLNKLKTVDVNKFCEECAKELAARLLAKVIKRTPVGDYDRYWTDIDGTRLVDEKGKQIVLRKSSKKGGTLRRGWTSSTQAEAIYGKGRGKTASEYVNSLKITKTGSVYQVEIINPVHYASYVEFGHRTRNHKGWVKGKFMLTISERELNSQAPAILEKKLLKYLGDAFNA